MDFFYNNTKVSYKVLGKGKKSILMLHGWGDNGKSMEFFCDKFKLNKKYIIIDFPPFGESGEINGVWGVEDYAKCVITLLDILKTKKVDIISHSFGGRVAIYLANHYTEYVDKMLLIASAGLMPKHRWKTKLKVLEYKLRKRLNLSTQNFGSADYKALDESTKKTFSRVVNYNQKNQAKNITKPVLIIAGEKDTATPLYMQKKLNKYIKTSSLIIFKNASHFAHFDQIDRFIYITNIFLKD